MARYEVFKQDRLDGPFPQRRSSSRAGRGTGLANARDVFARRPACVALWVVPDAGYPAADGGGIGRGAKGTRAERKESQ